MRARGREERGEQRPVTSEMRSRRRRGLLETGESPLAYGGRWVDRIEAFEAPIRARIDVIEARTIDLVIDGAIQGGQKGFWKTAAAPQRLDSNSTARRHGPSCFFRERTKTCGRYV